MPAPALARVVTTGQVRARRAKATELTLTFLTPAGGLVVLAVALPLAAWLVGGRRSLRVRRLLGVGEPPKDTISLVLLITIPALLALVATQPALSRTVERQTRTDAAVFVVFDVSRSMLASASPGSPTRLRRAKEEAVRLRAALPDLPFGVATLTDRVVPLLFPTADQAVFDSTTRRAVRIDGPAPVELAPNATSFQALGDLGTQSFFTPATRHRVVVLLSDGESQPYDTSQLASDLAGTSVVVLRFWQSNERVYSSGHAEPAYRPDPQSAAMVEELAAATRGRPFGEGHEAAAASAIRGDVGGGPTAGSTLATHRAPLGFWLALAALVPLALLAWRRLLAAP